MRLAFATLLALVFSACVLHAEENRLVKVYTLKNGTIVVAARSITMIADGTTTYTVTDMNGSTSTFTDRDVERMSEESVAEKNVPERFRKPSEISAASLPTIFASALHEEKPGGNLNAGANLGISPFDLTKSSPLTAEELNQQLGVKSSESGGNRASNVEAYTGPNLGFQPDAPRLHHTNDYPYYYYRWFGGNYVYGYRSGPYTGVSLGAGRMTMAQNSPSYNYSAPAYPWSGCSGRNSSSAANTYNPTNFGISAQRNMVTRQASNYSAPTVPHGTSSAGAGGGSGPGIRRR